MYIESIEINHYKFMPSTVHTLKNYVDVELMFIHFIDMGGDRGGYNNYNRGDRGGYSGGYNQSGYQGNQGGYNQGGYNQGGYSNYNNRGGYQGNQGG